MYLIYNSIAMKMLTLDTYRVEAVYDKTGTDYLYSKYFISGNFLINGQAEIQAVTPTTTVDRGGLRLPRTSDAINRKPDGVAKPPAGADVPPPINIAAQPLGVGQLRRTPAGAVPDPLTSTPPKGVYAPAESLQYNVIITPVPANVTIQSIEFLLNAPRGKLFVYSGTGDESIGEVILMSPRAWNFHVDAANGPKPRVLQMLQSAGNVRTMSCNFQIETCINKADENGVDGVGPLLSNRFSMRHVMSSDGFLTIEVEGDAVFNTERVFSGSGISPDDFRNQIFIPVPFGFTRESIVVEGYPDATGFRYSFSDVQREVHLAAAPYVNASDIECTFRQIVNTDTDILGGALNIYERGLDILVNTKFTKDESGRRRRRRRKKKPTTGSP